MKFTNISIRKRILISDVDLTFLFNQGFNKLIETSSMKHHPSVLKIISELKSFRFSMCTELAVIRREMK